MDSKTKIADRFGRVIKAATLTHDGTATVQTGYIDVRKCSRVELLGNLGATGTAAFTVLQATTSGGAGEKVATATGILDAADVVTGGLTYSAASGIKTYDVELSDTDLDVDNGFYFISLLCTLTVGEGVACTAMITTDKDYKVVA
jgi:hypothetical protein